MEQNTTCLQNAREEGTVKLFSAGWLVGYTSDTNESQTASLLFWLPSSPVMTKQGCDYVRIFDVLFVHSA